MTTKHRTSAALGEGFKQQPIKLKKGERITLTINGKTRTAVVGETITLGEGE